MRSRYEWSVTSLAFVLRAREAVAVAFERPRKVRTPQGTVLGNSQTGRLDGKRNREQTADAASRIPAEPTGKGETVV